MNEHEESAYIKRISELKLRSETYRKNGFRFLGQYCAASDKLTELGWCEFWDAKSDTWRWSRDGSGSLGAVTMEGGTQHSAYMATPPSTWQRLKVKALRLFGIKSASDSQSPKFVKNEDSGIMYEYKINKDGTCEMTIETD